MSEFITIQVGQCGNQIGATFWPSVLEEYGIQGITSNKGNGKNTLTKKLSNTDLHASLHSFFIVPPAKSCSPLNTLADLKSAKIKTRSILVDMEDSVVARFKTGCLRDLFDDKCIISNYPGSGNNWAEGYCCHGPNYENKILNCIRRAVDKCDCLQGFIILFSVGGGTGSGLGSYILKLLDDNFPHIERLVSCVYPTGTEDVITCPYNMALSTQRLTEHASCVFPVENRALLDIVARQWQNKCSNDNSKFIVELKPFDDMNNLVSSMLLHLTSGSRFSGNINVDINEISTNMVPFPKLHFLTSSFSPITTAATKYVKGGNSRQIKNEIFRTACSRNHQLLKMDPLGVNSLLLGTTLIGRGDFSVSDMRGYVNYLQSKGHFTTWSRKAIKIGLCDTAPTEYSAAMLCLFNSTSMTSLFTHVLGLYRKLYKKKAHVHHYTNIPGFEKDYFEECEESLFSNIESYKCTGKTELSSTAFPLLNR